MKIEFTFDFQGKIGNWQRFVAGQVIESDDYGIAPEEVERLETEGILKQREFNLTCETCGRYLGTVRELPKTPMYCAGCKAKPRPSENKQATPQPENKQGLPERVVEALAAAGLSTAADISFASDDELLAVAGIGPATLAQIRQVIG